LGGLATVQSTEQGLTYASQLSKLKGLPSVGITTYLAAERKRPLIDSGRWMGKIKWTRADQILPLANATLYWTILDIS